MSTEWIRQVSVTPDGVYLDSKSNNDSRHFHIWKCDSLTEVYQNEGQAGLDCEIVRLLCECAEIRGKHPSMERYRPCLRANNERRMKFTELLNAEYAKLSPDDVATIWLPKEQQTAGAKEYRESCRNLEAGYYSQLARLAAKLQTKSRKKNPA